MSDSFTVLLMLIASLDAVSSHFLLPVRLPTFGLDPNKGIASCNQKIVSAIHLKLKKCKVLTPIKIFVALTFLTVYHYVSQ
jgi:hypothetical protein